MDSVTEEVYAKGICERIGQEGSVLVYAKEGGEKEKTVVAMPTHKEAISYVLNALVNKETGAIASLDEIGAVGHRVVHGGEHFSESCLITDEVMAVIAECAELAPLHNPANIIGIKACQDLMPGTPMVAVFDTAFHQSMPEKAYLYAIPYKYYTENKIRRYGFHGTSHSYVANRCAAYLNKDITELKTIICHLGNGASVTAVEGGKSIDTSMGLTPLEGLYMGTRSGDLDPAVIEAICHIDEISIEKALAILNKESGVYGMSEGFASDFRDLEDAYLENVEVAVRALRAYCYKVAKTIGSYVAAMNGVDVIAFTAGIGENSPIVRTKVCAYLGYLGITIDQEPNNKRGLEIAITTKDSRTPVLVIPTNEELVIAQDTSAIVKSLVK